MDTCCGQGPNKPLFLTSKPTFIILRLTLLLYLAHITGLKGPLFPGVVQAALDEPSPG